MRWCTLEVLWLVAGLLGPAEAYSRNSAELFVGTIPDLADGVEVPVMHAGNLLTDPQTGSELFFWSFDSKFKVTRPKTVLWFNGGPGCSSMDGVFLEVGPFRFGDDNKLHEAPASWHEYANLVAIDQPYGTGFSPAGPDPDGYVGELDTAADAIVQFMLEYLRIFPEHKADDFYIAGESYAGQYIPYIYTAWEKYNDQNKGTGNELPPVQGILLGNPWLDSAQQYLSYAPFIRDHHILKDPQDMQNLIALNDQCIDSLQSSGENGMLLPDNNKCNRILNYALQHYNDRKTCFNTYNYELEDTYPSCGMNWPPKVDVMIDYLSRADVREAIHAVSSNTKWEECSSGVHNHWHALKNPVSSQLMPQILDNIPVTIMIGDLDVICNGLGLDNFVSQMIWGDNPDRGFSVAEPKQDLVFNETVLGNYQMGRNLTVVHMTNGSHMLPVDLQQESRMLMHRLTGITTDFFPLEPPKAGSAPGGGNKTEEQEEEKQKAINDAMTRAYYQAGFTALIVVALFAAGVGLYWYFSAEKSLSWRSFSDAILHIGHPKKRFEYVTLNTFQRTPRPDAIVEEDEPEDV